MLLFIISCAPMPRYNREKNVRPPKTPYINPKKPVKTNESTSFHAGQVIEGMASYYGPKFHGKMTANGEIFNQNDLTCAHKTLPFNTLLKVKYLANGKTVIVRVNDRGPFVKGRILDLSQGAAEQLGLIREGTGKVRITILSLGDS